MNITQAELKNELNYDEATGIFTRKISNHGKVKIGDIAGHTNSRGYVVINIGKKKYKAHRLAWLYIYGEIPCEVDHINHIKYDNRIANLRDVDRTSQCRNASIYSNNKSGCTGVIWNKQANRWYSRIGVDGNKVFLGSFTSYTEAVDARKNAEILYGYHENHGKAVYNVG